MGQNPVRFQVQDGFANRPVGGQRSIPGLQICEEVQSLSSANELDGNDVLGVLHHLSTLAGGNGAHGHMVFLVGRSGYGVYAGRVGQDLVFRNEGRCRVLGDHESRIETPFAHEKGRKTAQLGIDQPLDAPFGYIRQL